MFCRVRPLLPEDGIGTDMVVSYPTSTEALGRGIELVQSGIKCMPFSFLFCCIYLLQASWSIYVLLDITWGSRA